VNGVLKDHNEDYGGSFNYDRINTYGFYLGQYPRTEQNIQEISELGVTLVLNLCTEEEINK
jgi:hypothetical protein